MIITLDDYFMGRRESHSLAMGPRIEHEAMRTVDLVNQMLQRAMLFGLSLHVSPRTGTLVSSGWRPPTINANTPGAAPNSKHMTGQALDVYDADGDLDEWLITEHGMTALGDLGLWMEHPSATKGWCHLQTVPPRSGRRCFYP